MPYLTGRGVYKWETPVAGAVAVLGRALQPEAGHGLHVREPLEGATIKGYLYVYIHAVYKYPFGPGASVRLYS
jgi:hypothetical protein